MARLVRLASWGVAVFLLMSSAVQAQVRPYIGFVYPAGGQQGTTFRVRVGGQGLDGVHDAVVSGQGVKAKVVEYRRRLGNQEMQLLREQARELRRDTSSRAKDKETRETLSRIEERIAEYVNTPACMSIASLAMIEITMASDAEPGPRELRVVTPRGVSNPLVFCVGQLPEHRRKPMVTSEKQVLGKEQLALRRRPESEVEETVTVPCTLNGQIASGESNQYRFRARKGQRLVISTEARQLVPFIADAVPGWFQPVLILRDTDGKEVAYNDDYRFSPDPVILYEVPKTGEYTLGIYDALYRGREDFVYRITIGETPFLTSIFPLGGMAGQAVSIEPKGWNLKDAEVVPPAKGSRPGIYAVVARTARLASNRMLFAIDDLPECVEKEPNDDTSHSQKVELPTMINGRIDRSGDWDVFKVVGRAGDKVVAEVHARGLGSPLDSVVKLTDASGKVLAFSDDHEDPAQGANTHHADSYFVATLPSDGSYYLHLGDTARNGGSEFAYRLRVSAPRPDFTLHVVPSSVGMRSKSAAAINVQVLRKDGFAGPIKLGAKDPPPGFMMLPSSVAAGAPTGVLRLRTTLFDTKEPVTLHVEGRAQVQGREIVREAIAAEDRMQAFLWRHLVPAEELSLQVFDPQSRPRPRRMAPVRTASTSESKNAPAAKSSPAAAPKFTKQQVAGRLRQLRILYEDGLLTDAFYDKKVAECEAAQ